MYVVGRPNIADQKKFEERLDKILSSKILTNEGPFATELEDKLAEYIGTNAVVVSNGTIALELALRAMGLAGKTVAVPSFTFIATVHAAASLDCSLVFYDVDSTGQLDLRSLGELGYVDGIIVANLFGMTSRAEYIQYWGLKNKVKVLFDSAHALGCALKTDVGYVKVGNFGDAETFSLHATKIVQGFEGGVITTKDPELARSLRLMRNFGYDIKGPKHNTPNAWGTNAKLSEVHAAMALTNLERIDEIIAHNKRVHTQYRESIGAKLVLQETENISNFSYVPIIVPPEKRDAVLKVLDTNQIYARKYFDPPCHLLPPYSVQQPLLNLPNTEELAKSIICLPTGLNVSVEDAKTIGILISKELFPK